MRIKEVITRIVFVVEISGESMWPRLVPGRKYLATSFFAPRVGDCVVFRNPKNLTQIFVKKVIAKESGGYSVSGELSGSTSSEEIGIVAEHLVLGRVLEPISKTLRPRYRPIFARAIKEDEGVPAGVHRGRVRQLS